MDALRMVLAADGSEPARAAERLIGALCRRDGPDFTAPSVAALVVTSPPPPAWTQPSHRRRCWGRPRRC